ncbi:16S rRNA (cytosine(967)-C(5))-methyltransferase RsmB [Endozoicomonas elysicola]|uniref:16S rRNA (cytosine(967)-C(5))-methyltransferase n=1 Tax=Endozoicomonas elysicola TaxID=305900 RepID=A0A081K663_9GAMM|nr:16S rRNA (cytosine(967)-C(5))-methyltransferase RsmB [Endozoicomonas elysicola]KEI69639.1 16S rRNA methyltransferase [Endozoicomonas elysicola]
MAKQSSVRQLAARAITRVTLGESLSSVLPNLQEKLSKKDQPLLAELSYGTLRYYHRLDAWLKFLTEKPLKEKEQDIHNLILVGLYQLFYTRIPPHAAIGETVQATRSMGKAWARGLVNGILRNAQRRFKELSELEERSPVCGFSHPKWLINAIKRAWPEDYQSILSANNQPPPMTLRVNEQKIQPSRYLKKLLDECIQARQSQVAPQAITLNKPTAVDKLPMFRDGAASVQDESAQLAATLIRAKPGDHILDACCAPGGKTCHLLELNKEITVDALDTDSVRLERVGENLQRLGLTANVLCGDATEPQTWFPGKPYNHILLDAPCSATGVIRRHPDIKLLRKAEDIEALAQLQQKILQAIWPLLKPGGTLLYATCSIMPQENHRQIEHFLCATPDAKLLPIEGQWGHDTGFGKQLFPGASGHLTIGDGFFYSLMTKTENQ